MLQKLMCLTWTKSWFCHPAVQQISTCQNVTVHGLGQQSGSSCPANTLEGIQDKLFNSVKLADIWRLQKCVPIVSADTVVSRHSNSGRNQFFSKCMSMFNALGWLPLGLTIPNFSNMNKIVDFSRSCFCTLKQQIQAPLLSRPSGVVLFLIHVSFAPSSVTMIHNDLNDIAP